MKPWFRGIDHVQLAAPPGCESERRRFWGELIGLAEIPKPPTLAVRGGWWFQCGQQREGQVSAVGQRRLTATLHELEARRDDRAVGLGKGGFGPVADKAWRWRDGSRMVSVAWRSAARLRCSGKVSATA